jgi:hypothetical protein
MAASPQPVKFGGRFVEPACSYSVYRRKHQNKDDRTLYVILSCRYHLAFRAGPLSLPYLVTLPECTCAPEPLSLVPPGTLLMFSFRAATVEFVPVPLAFPVVLCPLDVLLLLSEQPQSPCGLEIAAGNKYLLLTILPPFLRFSRRCVPNAVDHYIR